MFECKLGETEVEISLDWEEAAWNFVTCLFGLMAGHRPMFHSFHFFSHGPLEEAKAGAVEGSSSWPQSLEVTRCTFVFTRRCYSSLVWMIFSVRAHIGLQRLAWPLWRDGLSRVRQYRASHHRCRRGRHRSRLSHTVLFVWQKKPQDSKTSTPEFKGHMRVELTVCTSTSMNAWSVWWTCYMLLFLYYHRLFAHISLHHVLVFTNFALPSYKDITNNSTLVHCDLLRLGIAYRKSSWRELGAGSKQR